MPKRRLFFLILVGIICVIIFLIITQSYPPALVNWQPISVASFSEDFKTAIYYYQKAVEVYNKSDTAVMNSAEIKEEIKRAILDKSIENILILKELKKHLSEDELEQMVKDKISGILEGKDIAKQVKTLYDLSLDEFRERILEPEAKMEILEARLLLENKNFNDWLREAKKQAKVVILLPGFEWNGEKVVIKQ